MDIDSPAYLSIIQWASGTDEHARIDSLVASAGMDPMLATLAVRRGVPAIVQRIDASVRDLVLDELRRRGVMAVAPSRSEIRGAPSPDRVKRMERMSGGAWYACEMWRGGPRTFRSDDVFLIVTAAARTHRREHRDPRALTTGAGASRYAISSALHPELSSSMTVTHLTDLYLSNGSRLRIDGDKFSFDVLADERGYSDLTNMRRLVETLSADAPRSIVDSGFGVFRAPPDLTAEVIDIVPGGLRHSKTEALLFDFYSPWSWRFYRHLCGAGRSARR